MRQQGKNDRPLAPVDEANLALDHAGQVNVFLVAGLLEKGGFVRADGAPDMDALRAVMSERVAALEPLRRVVVRNARHHLWAEASPDLAVHIRLVAAVAGTAGLERLCGELMSTPLRQDRPPWELLIVPRASADGVGMVLRIHHALADGMAAASIVEQLFDRRDSSEPPAVPARPTANANPGRDLRSIIRRGRIGLHRVRMTLWGREVRDTVLLGERSPHRGVAFLDADLAGLERHARSLAATVNDALLAAVSSGYRAALAAGGEAVPDRLPVSVPVALQRREGPGNQVGVMLVRLPLGEHDPDECLRIIAAQTRVEKEAARQQGTLEFMRGPIGARILDRVAHRQHLVAGFVTNVPGPRVALTLAGAPVTAMWPVAVLAANVRLNVAAISYNGRLRCGIHFDAEHVAGIEFANAMGDEIARTSLGGGARD